ncbi:digestive organ expansion factor homolog [Nilaparvata lugens]|uniref:digestive organ expansion factor homolog n=1 Tax=Nilaparvata lugens TaxID=108931 RepID=UPI00193D9718|nr:digestive organ expansion factor homolog [Nilaparvata lugens]
MGKGDRFRKRFVRKDQEKRKNSVSDFNDSAPKKKRSKLSSLKAGTSSKRIYKQNINRNSNSDNNVDDTPKSAFGQLVETLNTKQSSLIDSGSSEDEIEDAYAAQDNEDELSSDSNEEQEADDEEEIDQGVQDVSPTDPFEIHFHRELSESLYEVVSSQPAMLEEQNVDWPNLGNIVFRSPKQALGDKELGPKKSLLSLDKELPSAQPGSIPTIQKLTNLDNFFIKTQLQGNVHTANSTALGIDLDSEKIFTPLQKELLTLIKDYQDLYFPGRTLDNAEEIRFVYCLHAINHALKTRLKVIHHNSRLVDKTNVPEEFRDQGLVRPKVLILVPFRDSALKIIKNIISILLPDEKSNVVNKKRFLNEFTGGELAMPNKNPKPVDYERTFKGNVDDNFRIGISVTKRSLKLYADFYSSDIIVASPLGLRVIIGAEGESERDYDFLASIELLILDQTEVFLMQNWDHLLHMFEHLHMQPQKAHGTDFSRIRSWALNGWSQYYRQTLLLSSQPLPLITALFQKKCTNYSGAFTVCNNIIDGSICQVAVKMPQVFCKIDCSSAVTAIDRRLKYFIDEILPQMRDPFMKHCMIYIPSYLDFVLIRNYFKKELISFVQICEYSKDSKIARARDKFFHGESHFLLYSERFHFYRRIRVKGIRHIVFFQPPSFPNFYSELCNLIHDDGESNVSVTTIFNQFDVPQLSAILGSSRTRRLMKSSKVIHRLEAT